MFMTLFLNLFWLKILYYYAISLNVLDFQKIKKSFNEPDFLGKGVNSCLIKSLLSIRVYKVIFCCLLLKYLLYSFSTLIHRNANSFINN
jgi:hypothetical protein